MPWYLFDQNNTGGRLEQDDKVDRLVFIEADFADFANCVARRIGISFRNSTCGCCGPRWEEAEEQDALEEPEFYGWKPSSDHMEAQLQHLCGTGTVHLYHKDGSHERVTLNRGYVTSRSRT